MRTVAYTFFLSALCCSYSHAAPPIFTDVTAAAGINYSQWTGPLSEPLKETPRMSGSAAAGDVDGDGWVDLYVTILDGDDIIYHNNQDGSFSVLGTNPQNLDTNGAAWGDVDNDDDLDLYITGLNPAGISQNLLFINDGAGSFTEESVARGVDLTSPDNGSHQAFSATFGDYDRDGYLDMHTTEWNFIEGSGPSKARLFRNQGSAAPGFFTDTTDIAGVNMDTFSGGLTTVFAFASRFADMDRDGNPDLIVAADFGTSKLYWNNGDGTFTDGTVAAGVGTDENGMGSAVGDFNGDGLLDWFVTSIFDANQTCATELCNWGNTGNRLYLNNGDRTFTDATDAAGVRDGGWGWGAAFFDFDNDGDLDLTMTNGVDFPSTTADDPFNADPMKLWRNNGDGTFTDVSVASGITDTGSGKGLLTFDYDNDGDLDMFVVNNGGQPVLYRNDGGNNNDWIKIDTVGTVSNRDGLGAFITLTAEDGGASQVQEVNAGSHFLGQSEFNAHFGLGDMSIDPDGLIDTIEIQWPSGIIQTLNNVPINALLSVNEPQLGDISQDGKVDIGDFTLWGDDFGQTGQGLRSDISFDGKVDIGDFTLWGDDFGSTSSVSTFVSAVPEPGGIALIGMGMAGLLAAVWRRQHRRARN